MLSWLVQSSMTISGVSYLHSRMQCQKSLLMYHGLLNRIDVGGWWLWYMGWHLLRAIQRCPPPCNFPRIVARGVLPLLDNLQYLYRGGSVNRIFKEASAHNVAQLSIDPRKIFVLQRPAICVSCLSVQALIAFAHKGVPVRHSGNHGFHLQRIRQIFNLNKTDSNSPLWQ